MDPIYRILYAETVDMSGFPVRQPLPTHKIQQFDPFLLLHHHKGKIEPGSNHRNLGVGPHPHRGFSPVTFVFQGSIHHRDSRGNSSIIDDGGVQWMNAGMGMIHSERPSSAFTEKGGTQEIIQLWINASAAHKMDTPSYHAFQNKDLGKVTPSKGTGYLSVISGNLNDVKGPMSTTYPLDSAMGIIEEGSEHEFRPPADNNTALYLLDGKIHISGHGLVEGKNLILFESGIESIEVRADNTTRFLYVSGRPIGEPVATFGPYVMNNQAEILKAMRDYQMGKMGVLIEDFT